MSAISQYDVIVVGGGPAGIVAATQASRAGATTLLVEKSGILGGATILNGVNFPGLFHAWGRQVIAGIGWDLVLATVKESNGTLPDFSQYRTLRHSRLQIRVNQAIYASLADQVVRDSGAELLFHSMPVKMVETADGWTVLLGMKEGLREVKARVVIDATGDANLVRLAGFPLRKGKKLQPATLIMNAAGYSFEGLDFETMERAFEEAVARGEMLRSDFHAAVNPVRGFLHNYGNNAMHVPDVDGETSEGKTRAEIVAREAMLRIIRFLRKQPGLENFHILHFSSECGIRETVAIEGETVITDVDYTTGRCWEDSLCHSFYPIDVHLPDGVGIQIEPLSEGVVPTIPLGAMLPKGSRNLIVAGRCASGDQRAQSAFRVQASCMAMGQVAGAVAALATGAKRELREVPLDSVRELLGKNRAIVPTPPQV